MKNRLYFWIKCCLAFLLAASNTLFSANNASSFNIDDLKNNEFIPNLGQIEFLDSNFEILPSFYTKSSKQTILFYQDRFAFIFKNKNENSDSLEIIRIDMIFENANPNLKIVGANKKNSHFNFYNLPNGNELTKIPTYYQIKYQNIYKDIDLIVYDNNGELEYDFILHPGANFSDIKLKLEGTENYLIDEQGNLQIENQFSKVIKEKPICYQVINNERVPVKSQYSIENEKITFEIGDYISSDILVIDPIVRLLGSYYGGTGADNCNSTFVDGDNNIYILGRTSSTEAGVISTPGAFQLNLSGNWDLFVAKFNPEGERIWGTYYGGPNDELADGIIVDNQQNIFFSGKTGSSSGIASPSGVYQSIYGGGVYDGFFVKLNPDGTRYFASYYGGSGSDEILSIAFDQEYNFIIAGSTSSTNNISTPLSHQPNYNDNTDGFIAKFNSNGNRIWATYYGGNLDDRINSVSCDLSNNIYMIGNTYSSNDIATLNSYSDLKDAFIVKFNSNGARQWGRYFGGTNDDYGNKIAVYQNSNLYIAGQTKSESGIATINSHQEQFGSIDINDSDGFLSKFDLNGNIIWGTYYGGDFIDEVNALKVDNNENIIITGITSSSNNIATPGEYQSTIASAYDGFLAKLNSNGERILGTYYGGNDDDRINGIAVKSNNDIVVCGYTFSTTGISTPGSHQENFGGGINTSDAFFAILTDNPVIDIISINPQSICEGETCDIIFAVTNGGFQSNNTFTAQLSDENGNFENPVNIGTTPGIGSGVLIAQIPLGTLSGSNYLIRIISSNPETISSAYSQSITINSLPQIFNVTGGGSYCEGESGVSVGLDGSEIGVDYELQRDGNSVTNLAGTGNTLDFGLQTQAGMYTVTAENTTTLCSSNMLGSAIITIEPFPTQFNVTGGGAFCEGESGVSVGLDDSEIGINYELQRDGNLVITLAGTGNALNFGLQTQAGTYTVTAENTTTLCTSTMLGSAVITIEPVPTQFNVTGGGAFCEGESGVSVGLDDSELGINYELFRDGNSVLILAGTGNALDFGLQTQAGTYTVTAENLTTLCASNMLGSAVITIEPVPTQFNVTGGGAFCEGESGVSVGLDGSEIGVDYELFRDGNSVLTQAGTGNALDFGLQTQAGTYTVTAENLTTLCTSNMLGSAVITIEPVPTQFNVTGGGAFCEGESGVSVGLDDSELGINYELLRDENSVLSQSGTGNALDFGLQTQAGTYTITAENITTLCSSNMLGSAVITIEPVPTQFNVTGGGAFCEGESGVSVGLDDSELGINYELFRDGNSVLILAGTGNALDFGLQTQAGTYTVTAENLTTLCASNMLGSAVITIEPVPTQFNVTGGGVFCDGENGIAVGLDDSELGINYELLRDGISITTLAGTGNALDFGLQTQAGTYTVTAENLTTLCASNMLGSAVITIEPVPTQFNVTGGGVYCEGESGVLVGLSDSELGINYKLLRDGNSVSFQAGTGNPLDFGLQTQAGTYTVTAENSTTLCTSNMLGSAVITIEPLPTQFNVTGGGVFCEGENGIAVGLDDSELGINYELLRDGISITTLAGTGNALDFGLQTQAGTYTVTAENTTTLCTSNMLGSAVITIEPVPTQFNVTGGGVFCEGESGVSVGLSDSEIGINYELFRDGNSVLTQAGTGNALDFGLQTQAGTYTVTAENTTTLCSSVMLGSAVITISPLPTQFNVTGGGAFCEGESGVSIGLDGSELGINYELFRDGNSVLSQAGTGNALDFGLQTQAGTYTVTAENSTTLCTSNMLGSAVITIEPLPTQFNVTGGGVFCDGENGIAVGLDDSELGINYELFRDGNLVITLAGTGNALDFGLQTQAGTYTVTAENTTTLCSSVMLGSAVITISPLPTQFNVTGGGAFCEGESGVSIGLDGSELGINYELFRDGNSVLSQAGTGNALDFGLQTQAGTYTVTAENSTTLCTSNMLGSAVITIEPVPTQFNVTGGGAFCDGESGVAVGLSDSELGINYELFRDGNSVSFQAGTGNPLDFGLQTQAGTYTVTAENSTTLCTSNMLGSAVITIEPLPTQFNVTGGGAFCEGESGVSVGLDGSEIGVDYELFRDGNSVLTQAGTGNALDFGLQTQAGTYTITAENSTTLCTSTMLGSAVITIEPVPTQFNVTGGGAFCEGESGVPVGLDDSEIGINYELFRDGNSVLILAGTGNALDFGLQTQAGTYTVTAENLTTLCTSNMLGSAVITIEPLPTQFNVTGGGAFCEGESGVSVGLDGSEIGVDYELFRDGNSVLILAGTGNALDFGLQTQAGTYTVTAENLTTLCTSNMLGSAVITIEPVPTQFNVTGGGAFCEGESGVPVGLDDSEIGINYELFRDGNSVLILAGTGNALDFGLQTQAGTYTVTAENLTTLCTSNMLGSAVITIEPVPTQFNVTGGGAFCEGESGVPVGLDDSEIGINYELFRDGNLVINLAGTGNSLDFGLQTQAGTYTVTAENTTTLCISQMLGSAVITIEPLPTQFNVTGGGAFCEGESGVSVGLDGSEIGVDYELFRDGNSVLILAGTGNALDFGLQTQAGTYTVTAENLTTLCTSNMLGSAVITIEPVPTQFNVTGGGAFCEGESGVPVGLDDSEIGINYELFRDGNSVSFQAGTGNPLDFGLQTQAGTYTVTAENSTTLCTSNMLGSAVITIEPLPTQFNVTGGGAFCEGASGVSVGLDGSEIGVDYELFRDGNSVLTQAGTGNALDFGLQTQAGTYTITAENLTTLCASNMLGSAVITIEPLPTQFNVTGGGAFCEGESGVSVGLSDSEIGTNYELFRDGVSVLTQVGTGNTLDFGLQTQAGTYTITAENTTTLCTSKMLGSAEISINPLPIAVITGETSVIVGDEVSYTAENTDNSVCYWFVTNGEIIGSSNANPVTIRWTNVGTGTVKLILENSYLCKDSTEISVQIAPNFEYSIQGSDTVCLNTEANYAISGENSFEAQWSVQNAVIIGNSNEKNVLINFSQTGIATIFARITNNATGQVFNLEKSVTVLELPDVNLDEFSDICLNEPEFVLTGGTPLGGEYSGSGVSNGIFYPGIAGAGEHTIAYTYTNEFGCSNSVSATIKVNSLPEKPVLSFDGEKLSSSQAESYIWYLDSNEIETSSENYYYPQKDGNYSVTVIDTNGCQSELSNFLQVNFPKPVADIKISIAIDSASVGDTIKIPIYLEKATNLDTAGITDFTASIHLNSTMLKPIGITPNGSIVGNIRTIQIEGAISENSEVLYEMQFVVTLGNSECTQIIIDEIDFIGGDYRLEKQDGVFCIKDLCEQNGTRLFAETYPIYLSECVPNPAADEFSISFNLIEEAQTTLTIYNLFGTEVLTIFDKVATAGTYSLNQDINDLTNGVYILVLKTPSHNLARMLRVVK